MKLRLFDVFILPGEKPRWGQSFLQTAAPARHRARGSVSHDSHWWVKSARQDLFTYELRRFPELQLVFYSRKMISTLIFSSDYLNNLSPDSKEYEDTQGAVNM